MNPKLVSSPNVDAVRQKAVIVEEYDAFEVIKDQRYEDLPLKSLVLPENVQDAKRRLVENHTASIHKIREIKANLDMLMTAAIDVFVWNGEGDPKFERRREKLKEVQSRFTQVSLEIVDSLFAEIMVQDPIHIRETFLASLIETLDRLFGAFVCLLEQMQEKRVIGNIKWMSTDVCIYDFYRTRRVDRHLGTQNVKRTERVVKQLTNHRIEQEFEIVETVNEFEVADVLEHHEHQLYNARRVQLPAKDVRKPRFVEFFLKSVPAWLAPHVFIVEGDMLRETIETTEKSIEKRRVGLEQSRTLIREGLLMSPAVTLGSFVLTGWSGKDL